MTVVEQRERQGKAPAFAPADLDGAPRVDGLLRELGLGEFDRDTISSPPGRNQIWIGATTRVEKVFVKRLIGPEADVRARVDRMLSFQRFAEGVPAVAPHAPRMLGHDREAGLVVFEGITEAVSGAQLMVDEDFSEGLSRSIGRVLGSVHAAEPPEDAGIQTSAPHFPSAELLRALPMQMFDHLSFGELQAWGLMQGDPQVASAVEDLLSAERSAPQRPTHCDFRVDQVLARPDGVLIADWEEFRLADAARDVGGFAGEWLYRSVLDIVTTRGGLMAVEEDLSHEDVLERGAQSLTRLRPYVHAFWQGYLETRGPVDGDLRRRATAYAGWHLLDRLLAGSSRRARLSGIERAAAGIGRAALLTPDRFAEAVGIEEAS
ncbi:class V lanthionine synthetase subunit LxmK [Nocardiopsis aegyptia]|uniref:class V lanthionine synthetase subunit LxmK n=1 Tax=Nocardiopsis aegyptia TaxID=220378 RepID=UPI00366C3EE1